MKVVIMAGGKGTRISSVASDIPKPMIKIEGIPVLEREIKCLKDQGFDDIIMTVSHLGNIIMDYFGDGSENSPATGKPFGVHIEYYFEKEPLGNAGALFKIKDKLTSDFLLLNADAMFDVDFNRFVAFHRKRDGLVTLFTHPNSHPYDSGLIVADIVSVPDSIGINIKKYQNQCDKWLFNKLNEHEFWEKDDSGNKLGVGVCSESFIYWLNEFVLKDSKEKAYIVRKSINNYDESLPTIYY